MISRRFSNRFSLVFILFLVSCSVASAQYIRINEDPSVRELMEKYIRWEKEESQVSGWRIQIINTDDRRKMEKALYEFKTEFPEVSYVNWKQVSPYYKVIIGAYETKLDVLAFLQDIKVLFPSAIPVIEKIDEKELFDL
jgi:hypothetical protein